MGVTRKEKGYEYRRIAEKAISYIETCAKWRVVPLKHDAALLRTQLNQNDARRLS